jgi:DNA mismatch repair protein MutS
VVRIVTPGTLTDEALLEERRENLLAAVNASDDGYGLAWLELSSGRFAVLEVPTREALAGELTRLSPAETLFDEDSALPAALGLEQGVTRRPVWHFERDSAERLLTRQFGSRDLTGFGCADMSLAVGAAGCLLQYVQDTQRGSLPHIRGLSTELRDAAVVLDAATRRNLEITESLSGRREHTLAGVMDRTATPMGSRLLRRWLGRPLRDAAEVRARHQAVAELAGDERWRWPSWPGTSAGGRCRTSWPASATSSASSPVSPWAARARGTSPSCASPSSTCQPCSRPWPSWTAACCAGSPTRPTPAPGRWRCCAGP